MRHTILAAIVVAIMATGSRVHGTITPYSEDFDEATSVNSWSSVGGTVTVITHDDPSANDYDKNDWLDATGNPLDGDNIVGNLAGDDEAVGDGVVGDGGILMDSQDATAGNEAIGRTIGGTMEEHEAITVTATAYNDGSSFHSSRIQLYNLTDDALLAETANGLVQATANPNYSPIDFSLTYTADADDVGDTLQIRIVENCDNVARNPAFDIVDVSSLDPDTFQNGDFELQGGDGTMPYGWIHVDISANVDHGSIGSRPSGDSSGGKTVYTVDGGRWLNGGNGAVFSQRITDSMQLDYLYEFSVANIAAGSSIAWSQIYMTDELQYTNVSGKAVSALSGTELNTGSPADWTTNSISYRATPGDVGNPLYVNVESYRAVSTAVTGWDKATATITPPTGTTIIIK